MVSYQHVELYNYTTRGKQLIWSIQHMIRQFHYSPECVKYTCIPDLADNFYCRSRGSPPCKFLSLLGAKKGNDCLAKSHVKIFLVDFVVHNPLMPRRRPLPLAQEVISQIFWPKKVKWQWSEVPLCRHLLAMSLIIHLWKVLRSYFQLLCQTPAHLYQISCI